MGDLNTLFMIFDQSCIHSSNDTKDLKTILKACLMEIY